MLGRFPALAGADLDVQAGEIVLLSGANGAGKTTLLRLCAGLLPLRSGQAEVLGVDLAVDRRAIRRSISLVGHETACYDDLSVRENVRIAVETGLGFSLRAWLSAADKRRVADASDEVLAMANLTAKADRLVGELSHGDQRAAEIAMALALKPSLLLLDEPTAGMGDEETYQVTGLIRRLHRNSKYTIVLIEHDMRVVFHLADRISVLAEGKLLAEGTPEEITHNEHVQNAYLGKAE